MLQVNPVTPSIGSVSEDMVTNPKSNTSLKGMYMQLYQMYCISWWSQKRTTLQRLVIENCLHLTVYLCIDALDNCCII